MTTHVRILLVDDDADLAESIAANLRRFLADRLAVPFDGTEVEVEQDFDSALQLLSGRKFDVLILDILRDPHDGVIPEDAGRNVFEEVRHQQFLPIIFYAGDPRPVDDLVDPPFVQAVEKNPDPELLLDAVASAVNSGLPAILRKIHESVDGTVNDFVATFVMRRWDAIQNSTPDLAYLLARQLGSSFVDSADEIAAAIADATETGTDPSDLSRIHPHRFYAAPPRNEHSTGDIYRRSQPTADDGYFVLLTPTCDLDGLGSRDMDVRPPKAEFVLVGRCRRLETFEEFTKWNEGHERGTPSNTARKRLVRLLESRPENGQSDRYFFLPTAWGLPDLLADLQDVSSIRLREFLTFEKVASLDDPFAQALSQQYVRFVGRIGVPDLDLDVTLGRMQRRTADGSQTD